MLVQGCHNRNQLQQSTEAVNNCSSSLLEDTNQSSTRPCESFLPGSTLKSDIQLRSSTSTFTKNTSHTPHSYSTLNDSVNNNNTNTFNTSNSPPVPPTIQNYGFPPNENANLRANLKKDSKKSNPQDTSDLIVNSILSDFDLVANIKVSPDPDPNPNPDVATEDSNHIIIPLGVINTVTTTTTSPISTQIQGLVHSQTINQFNKFTLGSATGTSDAYLSSVKPEMLKNNPNIPLGRQTAMSAPNTPESLRRQHLHNALTRGGLGNRPLNSSDVMSSSLHTPSDKREKMEYNQMMRSLSEREGRPLSYHGRSGSVCYEHGNNLPQTNGGVSKRHIMSSGTRSRKESVLLNRRSMPGPYLENRFRDKFDVSELDTNLPRIDLEAIESHLRQAREEERKRRSDRDEIRRRLALESDEFNDQQKPRKNLHSRLQSSMNLQICFMNETASDSESPNSDTEIKGQQSQPSTTLSCVNIKKAQSNEPEGARTSSFEDFILRQGRLQAEARQALAQAKEMARLQMIQERDKRSQSPITVMVRNSLEKVGISLPPDRRRVSRQLLTEMNVAQLQVIVNDLHSHIEKLNETLVSMLLERDDLHMEQDSMLVDIEDLTRYLAAKYNSPHQSLPLISASQSLLGKK